MRNEMFKEPLTSEEHESCFNLTLLPAKRVRAAQTRTHLCWPWFKVPFSEAGSFQMFAWQLIWMLGYGWDPAMRRHEIRSPEFSIR
jgi:hypothetical protein